MGKMMTTALWNAIETIPPSGGTRKHWQMVTGSDWAAASTLLRVTGMQADTIPCFNIQPGGCYRSIIRHNAGKIRAVCAEPEKLCSSEKLTVADAEQLAVDRVKLAASLVRALQLTNGKPPLASEGLLNLGYHYVHAGLGFPVFLLLGGGTLIDAATAFAAVESFKGAKLVLTPTAGSLNSTARAYLAKIGATTMALSGLVGFNADGMLAPIAPIEQLFATLRAEFENADDTAEWLLPADATWSKVTIEFRELQEIEAQYQGVKPKRITPQDLRLWDAESGRPKASWNALMTIPSNGGLLKPLNGKQTADAFKQVKKQLKEVLSKVITIPGDPFEYDRQAKAYRPHFLVRADALRQGREDQNW